MRGAASVSSEQFSSTSATASRAWRITRGVFWEMTAVPDIGRQCATLAAHLADRLRVPGAGMRSSLLYA